MRTILAAQLAVTGPDQLVLGFAVDEGNPRRVLAVGGQRRDLNLLSEDGGATWTTITSPGKGLRGAFLDGPLIWVVGEYGFVARSTDGGDTWTEFDIEFSGCLFGVTRDEHGTIIVAGDGGRIAACSDGVTFKTVGGIKVSLSRLYKCKAGIFIPTDAPGDVVHVGSVMTKGEAKPKATLRAIGSGADLMTTTMSKTGTMVIVGDGGAIFRSTDSGETWTKSTSPTTLLLAGVCAQPSGRFVAVGANGLVITSDDDGVTFTPAPVTTDGKMLWSCVAVGDDVLFGAGDGRIFRMRDVEAPTSAAELPAAKGTRGLVHGVLIDDELRKMVFQWRGGTIAAPLPPLPTAQDAWKIVREQLVGADTWRSSLLKRPSTTSKLLTDATAAKRRLAARLQDEAVRVGSFIDDAELVAATFEGDFASSASRPRDNALVDMLVVQHGVVGAVERVFAGLREELPYSTMGVFERLRERVVTSSDADYEKVLALALPAIARAPVVKSYDKLPSAVRSAWAFVLPLGEVPHETERAVLAEAVRFIGEFGSGRIASPGVLASVDDAGMSAFFKANGKKPRHEFFAGGERAYIATALVRGLTSLFLQLPKMRPEYDLNVFVWGFVIGHVDSDEVVGSLLKQTGPGLFATQVAAVLDPQRFFTALQKKKETDRGTDLQQLEALLAATSTALPPSPTFDLQRFAARASTTAGATAPLPPSPLRLPASLDLAPELTWRDDERDAAESATPYEGHWLWQGDDVNDADADKDPPPLKNASAAVLDAWVALREAHKVPSPSAVFVLVPTRLHPRLLALGAAAGEKGVWTHFRGALLKNPDTVAMVRAWLFDDAVDLDDRLTVVQPLGDVHAVPAVVTAFAGKKHKALARSWILRHPRHAAAGALAMIVADNDVANSARVLRFVDGLGHRRTILQLAAAVDSALAARVQVLLDEDPLLQPGVKAPTVPAWAKAQALPALVDSDGTSWTAERTDALLVRMAASNPDEVNPAITAARLSLTKPSAAAFARALFEAWLADNADPKHIFAMHALGFFGDDDGIRRLATLARVWPGESAAARAQMALDTLVLHGGDSALLQLAMIGEKSKFAAFKKGARERITSIADVRGLTPDELADRLVPTLGLDDAATTTIDFGARQFSVTFDEGLVPRVKDSSGVQLKDLPKPNKADDATLAAAGKKQLSALKKDIKAIADLLLRRFERMMIEGRSVDVDTFRSSFVDHPLTFHVARRVLWEAIDDADKRLGLLRIAEDRTFADLNDDAWSLPTTARVRPVHPLDVDEASLTKASTVWGDYMLLQPFAQLGRPVHRLGKELTDAPTATALTARAGKTAPAPTLVFGLEGRGWKRYDIIDGGAFNDHDKTFGDVRAIVEYDGAVGMGFIEAGETLTLKTVQFFSTKTKQPLPLALGDVPARILSEVVVDIDAALAGKA